MIKVSHAVEISTAVFIDETVVQLMNGWVFRMNSDGDYLECGMEHLSLEPIKASFQITIVNQRGFKSTTKTTEVLSFTYNRAWFIRVLDLRKLRTEYFGHVIHKRMIVKIRLNIEGTLHNHSITPPIGSLVDNRLANLLIQSPTADVTIKVHKDTMYAHKNVLCSCSRVFQAMFSSNMIESRSSTIEITDFSPQSVRRFLQLLYGDSLHPGDQIEEMLALSCKYQTQEIQILCEQQLILTLSSVNVVETYELADKYSCLGLKALVLQYIDENSEEIVKSPEFFDNKIENELYKDIIKALAGVR